MVIIDQESCIGCQKCIIDCVANDIRVEDKKAFPINEKCIKCGHCIAICPKGAVSMDEYDMNEVQDMTEDDYQLSPDKLLNFMRFRRSIRQFQSAPVERDKIDIIIEAGRYSPTGSNAQNVSFIVVDKIFETIKPIAAASFKRLMEKAGLSTQLLEKGSNPQSMDTVSKDPLFRDSQILILTVSKSEVNASLASTNMELVAQSMGLGAVYIGYFVMIANQNKEIRKLLGLSEKDKVVTCLGIGYPDVTYYRNAPRKKAEVTYL